MKRTGVAEIYRLQGPWLCRSEVPAFHGRSKDLAITGNVAAYWVSCSDRPASMQPLTYDSITADMAKRMLFCYANT